MEKRIYLDNAATTFPKPGAVAAEVVRYMEKTGCNAQRGSYSGAFDVEEVLFGIRSSLKKLFNAPDEKNVIFTPSDTYSLNMLIKGIMRPGDVAAVSSMEHNAVMRPVMSIAQDTACEMINCDVGGTISKEELLGELEKIKCSTESKGLVFRTLIMNHGSNVCGSVLPIAAAGRFCRENGIYFIVDAAQTAGLLDIDVEKMYIDALSFSGHKGLYGPQGTGGFIISDAMAAELDTLIEGGTGSFSHLITMPDVLPDRFEPGTMNLPGIYGLGAALKFLEQTGTDMIYGHDMELAGRFAEKIEAIEGIYAAGPFARGLNGNDDRRFDNNGRNRLPVVSVTCDIMDEAELARRLEAEYGIWTRVGLHCAPCAHRTLGTFPRGTVRFSFGFFNTEEEMEYAVGALMDICRHP